MVQLIDVVRYNVHVCSEEIRQLKDDAGKPRKIPDFAAQRFVDVSFRHICPDHPDWKAYEGFKRECSLWLVVLCACKRIERGADKGSTFEELACNASHLPSAGNGRMRFVRAAKLKYEGLSRKLFDGIKREVYKTDKGKVTKGWGYTAKNYAVVEAWRREHEAARVLALSKREDAKVHG